MVRPEERSLRSLYSERRLFKDDLKHDRNAVFDALGYGRTVSVNGKPVRGILTRAKRARDYGDGVQRQSEVLTFDYDPELRFTSGQILRVNDDVYQIAEARNVQGVYWRLELIRSE